MPFFTSSGAGGRRLVLAVLAALVALTNSLSAADADPITEHERNRGFRARTLLAKPRADLGAVERAEARAALTLVRSHPRLGGIRVLETDGSEDVKAVVDRLAATGLYDYVEPDYIREARITPNDARFASDQWSLNNTGQSGGKSGADIKALAAWDIQREAPDVIIAVIDSGLNYSHEDIISNLWFNRAELEGRTGADDDNNGYLDDAFGINVTVPRTSPLAGDPFDNNGHGTHVAGIIAASGNNGKGIAGIAWKAQIMPLKFLGTSGSGSVSGSIACLDYAIAKQAQIINGSYGSTTFSQAEFEALRRVRDAGIIFVASAGNDSQEITDLPEYPAAYALDNIVAVASTTRQDRLASYSTFGSGLVELAAPGSSILSLGISGTTTYAVKSGTSMAAPHVSGALALLKQKFPGDSYRALINRLLGSVDVLPELNHRVHTNGRLNLLAALSSTSTRPFNDDFSRRAVITGEFNTVRGSNQLATREAGEPDHGVAGSNGSLWWSWTAPASAGKVTIGTGGSGLDAVLAVYSGSGATPTLADLRLVATNHAPGSAAAASSVTFDTVPSAIYHIAVAGKGTTEGLITFSLVSVPFNDAFAQARVLIGPGVVVTGNNAGASVEPGEPKPRSATGRAIGIDRSLWYRWTAPSSRPYEISATNVSTDPIVTLYTGTTLNALAEVAFDDDAGPNLDSLVRFNAIANVTYSIKVDTSFGPGGRFTLSIADAAWQYVTDDAIYASPALAPDGTLYVADSFGLVHALNPNGTRRWRSFNVTGYVDGGAIAVGQDGTLYVGDDLGYLYALNPANGARKWSFNTGDYVWAAPAIAADGTVYVKSDNGKLIALDPDGKQKWIFAAPGDTYTAPVIAADGTIYIVAGDAAALCAVNPADGSQKWSFPLGATAYATPALGADGTIYLGNFDGRFFAIRPDGSERWQFDTRSPLSGSAVVDARGVVYFGSYDTKLYALDAATGAKRWDYATGDLIRSTTPVLADDGTIYIGSDDGFVHALDGEGRLLRTYATSQPILSAPLITAGRLIVASTDGKLYAFDTGNNLARAPWPMHGQNLRHTARPGEIAGVPVISAQPAAPVSATAGSSVSIPALAAIPGGGALTYQWLQNDVALPGATSAILTLPSVQGSNSGDYRVIATGPGGSVISLATTLRVAAATGATARLVNLAVRTVAGSGDRVLFVGFVIGGAGTSGTKPLLLRGVGPALGAFGVPGTLADPRLQVFSGTSLLSENDDWAGDARVAAIAPQVGAFPLAPVTSKDAALAPVLTAGGYSAQISGVAGASGIVLAEIYDASIAADAATPRLINVSARTQVGTGANILIAGFVVGGTGTKQVLVRAIGPTLAAFGVPGTLADPRLQLFSGTTPIQENDNWGASPNAAQIATVSASVGAFPLALESRDAVLLLTLQPGSYTAQVSGMGSAAVNTGIAIVEVYEVP